MTDRIVTTHRWRLWSPAQFFAGLLGLALVVFGGVVIARTGLSDLTGATTTIWDFEHTALLGLVELVAGLAILVSATGVWDSRGALISFGLVFIAFGLIKAIEPDAFRSTLAAGADFGWTVFFVGVGSLLIGVVSPLVVSDDTPARV